MDSLTQITLGAAVGEVVLGKKAGNRAMFWGAVAGTLPDLDIVANFVTDPISALAYHRAFTHSFAFSILVPIGMGLIAHRLYGGKEGPGKDSFWATFGLVTLFFATVTVLGSWLMPLDIYGIVPIGLSVTAVAMLLPVLAFARERGRTQPSVNENPGWRAWSWLFFWAIITHPLLDACTTYGTQLLEPFSSLRVAWNVISVADPLYTAPFLTCLLLASRSARGSRKRSRYNWAGILISSTYLLVCTGIYHYAEGRMEATLKKEKIEAQRSVIGPTILNSLLWQGTAETADFFYTGQYSLLDPTPYFKLDPVPKNHHLLEGHEHDREVELLRWFTDDYYSVEADEQGKIRMNDLRYGQINIPGNERPIHIFYFVLAPKNGEYQAIHVQQGPEDRSKVFGQLWDRIMGRY